MTLQEVGNVVVERRGGVTLAAQAQLQRPELAVGPQRMFADRRRGKRQPLLIAGDERLTRGKHRRVAARSPAPPVGRVRVRHAAREHGSKR
jgi:plasmid stabilization system protein ParE